MFRFLLAAQTICPGIKAPSRKKTNYFDRRLDVQRFSLAVSRVSLVSGWLVGGALSVFFRANSGGFLPSIRGQSSPYGAPITRPGQPITITTRHKRHPLPRPAILFLWDSTLPTTKNCMLCFQNVITKSRPLDGPDQKR